MLPENLLSEIAQRSSKAFREAFGDVVEKLHDEVEPYIIVESITTIMASMVAVELSDACEFGLQEPTKQAKLDLIKICFGLANDYLEAMYKVNDMEKH